MTQEMMTEALRPLQEEPGKFMPHAYEDRIYGAVNALQFLHKYFETAEDVDLDLGEQSGAAWILKRVITELEDTALNCENGRRA